MIYFHFMEKIYKKLIWACIALFMPISSYALTYSGSSSAVSVNIDKWDGWGNITSTYAPPYIKNSTGWIIATIEIFGRNPNKIFDVWTLQVDPPEKLYMHWVRVSNVNNYTNSCMVQYRGMSTSRDYLCVFLSWSILQAEIRTGNDQTIKKNWIIRDYTNIFSSSVWDFWGWTKDFVFVFMTYLRQSPAEAWQFSSREVYFDSMQIFTYLDWTNIIKDKIYWEDANNGILVHNLFSWEPFLEQIYLWNWWFFYDFPTKPDLMDISNEIRTWAFFSFFWASWITDNSLTWSTSTWYYDSCSSFLDVGCWVKGAGNQLSDSISWVISSWYEKVKWYLLSSFWYDLSWSGSMNTCYTSSGGTFSGWILEKVNTIVSLLNPIPPNVGDTICIVWGTWTVKYSQLIPEHNFWEIYGNSETPAILKTNGNLVSGLNLIDIITIITFVIMIINYDWFWSVWGGALSRAYTRVQDSIHNIQSKWSKQS